MQTEGQHAYMLVLPSLEWSYWSVGLEQPGAVRPQRMCDAASTLVSLSLTNTFLPQWKSPHALFFFGCLVWVASGWSFAFFLQRFELNEGPNALSGVVPLRNEYTIVILACSGLHVNMHVRTLTSSEDRPYACTHAHRTSIDRATSH